MNSDSYFYEYNSGLSIPTNGRYIRIYHQDNGTTTVLDTGERQFVLNGRNLQMVHRPSLEELAGLIIQEPPKLHRALVDAIMANGLNENSVRYLKYSPKNRGCSTDNPFVIADSKHYVRLEYALMVFIFELAPGRYEWIRLSQQNIIHQKGRYYDLLQYVVTSEEETRFENYYFDITEHIFNE